MSQLHLPLMTLLTPHRQPLLPSKIRITTSLRSGSTLACSLVSPPSPRSLVSRSSIALTTVVDAGTVEQITANFANLTGPHRVLQAFAPLLVASPAAKVIVISTGAASVRLLLR